MLITNPMTCWYSYFIYPQQNVTLLLVVTSPIVQEERELVEVKSNRFHETSMYENSFHSNSKVVSEKASGTKCKLASCDLLLGSQNPTPFHLPITRLKFHSRLILHKLPHKRGPLSNFDCTKSLKINWFLNFARDQIWTGGSLNFSHWLLLYFFACEQMVLRTTRTARQAASRANVCAWI